jgi:hypothetical protein
VHPTRNVRSENLNSLMRLRLSAGFPASADGLMLAPLAPNPAGLLEHQRQGQTCVSAMVAISAANWILQQ